MHHTEQLKTYLEDHLEEYLELLRQMVAINSFTANKVGVNMLGQLTADIFAELDFTAETIPSDKPHFGNHVVLTKRGRSDYTIGLVSHLDTVFPPQEEQRNNFVWRPEGDRIYGPGTVDIKGGTLIIYMMMAALKANLPAVYDEVTWVILLDASEEAEAEDFGQLCIDRLEDEQTLACLIFEGGSFQENNFLVVVARKGMAVCQVSVAGRASHAGTSHESGANAIVQLADTIQKLAAITDYERGITVNVGMVNGGTVTNRVPHHALALLEMRAFSGEAYESAVADILSLDGQSTVTSAKDNYACAVEVEIVRKTGPWSRNAATDHLFAIWREAGEALGFGVNPEIRGGLSDGNHFWHRLPTLDGLGPSGGNAHCSERSPDGSKDQEYCLVPSFIPKTLLNLTAVLKLIETAVS